MSRYKCLQTNEFYHKEYALVPLRESDIFLIMQWRNEQLYHLRQQKPLTENDQLIYYNDVVQKSFEADFPKQILFSFLKNEVCVGYGGLVHINWADKNAELSFLMNTALEKENFDELWSNYLSLIEVAAFAQADLHKIYTYAFDIRPQLYPVLEKNGFMREAILKDHCRIDGKYKDVVIHQKIN